MEVEATIQCPYCGEDSVTLIDTSVPNQSFVTDCEVCCQPMAVTVVSRPGEILDLAVATA